MGTPGLWALSLKGILKNTHPKTMNDTKSSSTKRTYSILTTSGYPITNRKKD